jgi:hypothetical protein
MTSVAERQRRQKKTAVPSDDIEFFDVEQGSEAWHDLRRGLPTASKFADVMASSDEAKMRTKYLHRLAGEIVSGETAETFRSDAMDRGRDMEPLARAYYERTHLVDVEPIGFVKRTVRPQALGAKAFVIGASPDGRVSKRKGLEIKTMRPELLLAAKGRGVPTEHRAQCQGTMFAADFDEIDLLLFYDGRKGPMALKYTVVRDEVYIKQLVNALDAFCYDLRNLVAQWRNQ